MFSDITFAYPWLLWSILLIIPAIIWYFRRHIKNQPVIRFSSTELLYDFKPGWKERYRHLPFFLRLIAVSLIIIATARPQSFSSGEEVYTEGIDIAFLLDISSSMLAEDFKPNRLESAKKEIANFIEGRTSDKLGLVVFARESFTQCPLTIDYNVLRNLLKEIKSGMLEDGTAIGTAIANGVNRLRDSKAKSKVIILVTDGVNNSGEIDPLTAAQIAKTFDIRIYTIGVGTMGEAPYPFDTPFGRRYQMMPVEIDEQTLTQIAKSTGGKYFRATNNKRLNDIYAEIDKMEKTRVEITSYRQAKELFYPWALAGVLFLVFELISRNSIFRKLP